MNVELGVICDYANVTIDRKTNILGIFTDLNVPVFPFVLPQAFLVVTFAAHPSEAGTNKNIKIELVGADGGAPLFSMQQQDVTIPSPPRVGAPIKLNLMMGVAGLIFPAEGDYAINVLVNDEHKHSISLRVNGVAPATP